jgi:hypothetical protein
MGRYSALSVYSKLMLYQQVLKPVWTYGIQLWCCTSQSNRNIIRRFQYSVVSWMPPGTFAMATFIKIWMWQLSIASSNSMLRDMNNAYVGIKCRDSTAPAHSWPDQKTTTNKTIWTSVVYFLKVRLESNGLLVYILDCHNKSYYYYYYYHYHVLDIIHCHFIWNINQLYRFVRTSQETHYVSATSPTGQCCL